MGTTYGGGTSSDGTIYKIAAGTNTVTTILNFNGTNGSGPWGDLVADSSGNIYGTTSEGGAYTYGTVYEIAAGTNTVTTLASFDGTDGAYPDDGLFIDSSGNLWGTTESHGANGDGTVFKIASGSSTISLVNSFSSTTGAQPVGGLIVDSSGNVYGTTNSAGSGAGGTVFEIPSGSSNINVLATFTSASGYGPYAGLVRDSSGNLYGTTTSGGANGDGTVFELASGGNSITPLASFNGTNGSDPQDAVLIDSSGNLYGTAISGGANGDGTAFEVAAGSGTITTLASFNGANGNQPRGKLTMDSSGNLYGTTYSGGASSDGNIFELTPHTSSKLTFTSVPSSITAGTAQSINVSVEDTGGTTVTNDTSTVTLSIASGPSGGTIGGTSSVSAVAGVASFTGLTFTKAGTYTLTAAANGLTSATSTTITVNAASASKLAIVQQPTTGKTYHTLGSIVAYVEDQYGNVITGSTATVTLGSTTTLSGTTSVAAVAGVATFSYVWTAASGNFTFTAASSGLTSASTSSIAVSSTTPSITDLVSLNSTTGTKPYAGLIMDSAGNLYGTTTAGGTGNAGTAFKVAAGTNVVTTLENGGDVVSGLLMDSAGNLYGTTTQGTTGYGSIYKIAAGTGTVTTLANFTSSSLGSSPQSPLIMDASGNLYGTTQTGGPNNCGTIFELANGSSTITRLAYFTGNSGIGSWPIGGIVMDSSGNIYGTTFLGGPTNQGTLWKLASGSSTITTLTSFTGTNGASPQYTNLFLDSSGNLYGTTNGGGTNNDGTVFKYAIGSNTFTTLASFNGTNGSSPEGVVMDAKGNLFGVTANGVANNQGTVFAIAAGSSAITTVATYNNTNGQNPYSPLVLDSSGNMYGTTYLGGANNTGTVFEVTPLSGAAVFASQPTNAVAGASQSITVNLNTTAGPVDTTNQSPVTLSIVSGPTGGVLGGTTTVSAVNGVANFSGLTFNKVGTYVLQASSNGAFPGQTTSITVTHGVATQVAFTTQPANAQSGQSLGTFAVSVEDTYGNLVTNDNSTVTLTATDGSTLNGTTSVAAVNGVATFTNVSINALGSHTLHAADGSLTGATSSSITISAQGYSLVKLADFNGTNGSNPYGAMVMDSHGNLFGTTEHGGANSDGTLSEVAAGTNTITTLASFNSSTGTNPQGQLLIDSAGDLYGTTPTGGANNDGTVFEVVAGSTAITKIADFNSSTGNDTFAGVIEDSSGNLYGTQQTGGPLGYGTIYKIAPGTHTITVLASFNRSDGYATRGGLLMDSSGNLYGTSANGGVNDAGTVWKLASGSNTITLIASVGTQGGNPDAGLVMDSSGNLYGTYSGGSSGEFEIPAGTSTVIALTPNSTTNSPSNGQLILDSSGNLFGTANTRGANGDGDVFELTAGSHTWIDLGDFNGTNGYYPDASLVMDSSGDLYGVAYNGGANSDGTVFEVTPPPAATQAAFTSQPTTAVSGASQSFTVSLENSSGAVIAQGGTVTLSIASGPTGATLGGTLTATATNGVATFSGITFTKAGTYTLTAASNGLTSGTSATITVTAGAASKAVVAQVPSTATAGQTMGTVLVDITDASGNLVTSSTATVTLSGTSLTGTLSVAAVGGVATFNNLIMTTAGNQTITAAVSGLTSGTSSAIAVGASFASKLAFTAQPGNAMSSQSLGTVAVSVEDTYGNVVTTDNSTVTLTTSDGSTLNGTTSVAAVNGVATFTNLSINVLGAHTLHAVDGSLTTATSNSITISALSSSIVDLASFSSSMGNTPLGSPVLDSSGNLWGTTSVGGTNNLGTIWEMAAGSGTITTIASFSTATGGTPESAVVMDSSGNLYGTTYTGGANSLGTVWELPAGSSTITVRASFSNVIKGYEKLALDSAGNLYGTTEYGGTNNNGTIYEVAAGSNTMTTLASFPSSTGTPYRGVVVDGSGDLFGVTHSGGTSNVGAVYELPHGSSTITTLASFSAWDTGDSNPVFLDSQGNLWLVGYNNLYKMAAGSTTITQVVTGFGGTNLDGITMDSNGNIFGASANVIFEIPAGGSTPTTLGTLNGTNGAVYYTGNVLGNVLPDVVLSSMGTIYGVAPAGGANNLGAVYTVNVAPPASQAVFTSEPTTVTAGASQSFAVSLESAGGAVVARNGTVTLSIASGPTGATLGGTLTATATNGVATFTGITFTKSGTYTLTASSSGLTTATSTTITVNPAAANKVVFLQSPASQTASPTLGTVQVAIEDTYGNTITTSTATVTIAGTNLSGTTSVAAVAGVATFNNLILTTPGTYTLTAASGGVSSATTASFTVSRGMASKLLFAQQPTGASAGGSIGTVTVDVTDSVGNIITTDNSAVTLTISDGSAITGTTTVNAVNGVATFTGLTVNASGTHILSASDGSLTPALSNSFTMTIGSASRLVVIQQPANITAGQTVGAVEVAIEDAHGNIVTSNTTIVTLSAAGATGTLSQAAVNGVATFGDLSFTAAGAHTLAFSDGGLTSANSSSFTVTPAAPSQLVFAQQPTNAVAGQSIGTVIVDVKDVYGNIVTGNTSAVTLYASSAITGTTTVNAVNGVATFTGLSIHQAGTYTLSATQNGLSSATSNSITITPAAASQLVVSQQPAAITTAGQNIGTVVVNVEDQFGNIVTSNSSAVAVASTTTITGTTSVNAVNGVATFSGLSIHQSGSYSLTATDGSLTSATTSSFTIVPAAASKLAITQQPAGATVGQAIGTIIVQVQDTYGNLVTTDNSTVSVATSDSTPLSGATSVQAVNGIATFSGLSTTVAGTRTLTVTDGSLYSATSSSLTITPSAATHLVIAQQPTDTPAGSNLPTVVVQVEDQFGNVVGTDSSTVALSAAATLHGTISVNAVNGVATFTGLSINTVGNYSLSASDGSLTGTATNYFNITPGLASQLVITQQPVATRAGQTIGNVIAQVEDAFGNVVSTDSSTLTLAVTDGSTLHGVTSAAAVNGVATFTGLWCPTAGAHTLTVSDGSLTTSTSNSFTVVAADPTQLVIAQQPGSSTVAGQNIGTVIVNVEDQYGNVVTTDSTTVTLSSDDGSPILGTTSVAAVNGIATFTGLSLTEAGTHTLFATDGNYHFGETSAFAITPAAASQLVFNQQPGAVNAGQALGTISVNVEDAFGNVITTDNSTVTMVVYDGATLNGTATALASGGVATFTGLSINQAGVQALFASDGSLTPATSNSFVVNNLAATQLAFVQQPASAVAGQTIGAVQVNVEDTYGNIVTSDNSTTVTLYTGAAINGTTSVTAVNGVAMFSGLSINRAGNYTMSATNGNLTSATSSSFTISPSTANQLVFAQQPNVSTVAGQSIGTIHVDVEDQYGNLVTTDASSITLSSSATLNGTTTATASGGVATFSGLSIDQTGSYTLTATDSEANSATSNSLAITPAAASQLAFAQQPTTTTVGSALNTITVNVEDQYGNIVTNNQSTITLTAFAPISGATSVAAVNGVATFTGLSMTTAEDQQMHAADGSLTSATSNWFSTLPAATSQLVVTQQPGNAVAGQSIGTVVVQAEDAFGNVVTGSPLNGTEPDTADAGNAVWTANPSITTDGSEVNLESDEDATLPFVPAPGHVYVLSSAINPEAGNTTNWLGMGFVTLSTPAGMYAGLNVANNPQVWLLERDNRQTQFFDSSNGNGPTAANLTGYDSYAITLDTTGSNWTVSFAQDGTVFQTGTLSSNPAITGISIGDYGLAGSFRNLSLTQDGTAIYKDQFARGSAPTVTLTTSSGAAITGQTTSQLINGTATFTGLSIDQAGDYTISATQGSLPAVSTTNITITPAAPSQLVIAQQPTDTVAGQVISTTVVDVEDAFGNIVTGDSSEVSVSSTTALGGTLIVTANQGVAAFDDLSITEAGSAALTVSDGSLTPATSSSFNITAAAPAQLAFAQQPANAAATQSIGTVVVDVEDPYGNRVTTDNSTVDLSIVGGTPFNGSASQSAVNGIATFTGLSVNPAGTYTLSATDGGLTAATSNNFTIAVGAPSQLVVVQQPTTTVAGQTISPVEVAVEDAGGNVVTTDSSAVTVAGDATLGGTSTVSVANGLATFSDLSMTLAGSHSLSFTDANLSGATGNPFSITPAAAAQLVFLTQPGGATQSHAIDSFTVAIEDAYGNLVTSDNSTVTMSAADGTPLGGTTSVNAVNGVATFSNLIITKPGPHALLASDGSLTSASSSSIPVTPALTTLSITAPASSVTVGQTLQFTASGLDGAGNPIALDPVTWSLATGSVGSIDQNGLFNAGSISSSGGIATIVATCDGTTASMTVTVNAIPPVITVNAYAQMVSSTSNTGTLHVEGEQNGTDANLIYTWSIVSQPTVESDGLSVGASAGSPTPLAIFAINGTNAAKNTPVTFLASGQYVLQVVASNGSQSVTSEVQVTTKVNPKVAPAAVAQTTTVAGVQPVGTAQSISGFVVTFNGPVDPTTAQNVLGYRILRQYTVSEGRSFWQRLFGESSETETEYSAYKIASALYDSQTYSVTLTLASPMPVVDGVRLVQVMGAGAHAVLGANGKAIDGDFNGKPGGNFTYRFTMSVARTVSYKTTSGDLVQLSLTGPGRIVTIMPSNTATPVIDLLDTNPADSILTGTLHKARKGLGYAVIDQLNGSASADVQLGDEFHVNAVE